jgi:hypothetical protein
VSRGQARPEPTTAVIIDLAHLGGSADEEEVGLPSSTAPPRLEDPATTKKTRGKLLDFATLHVGVASRSVSLPH